jgi:DNA-binding NtrC family response regulator
MTVRLLVVDDEPDAEDLFRQQFRREIREGLYTLDFALSAMAALAILDEAIGEETILLVSDINMPGMSGLDLIPEVKVRRPDLPVFMISDYGDAERVRWRAVLMSSSPSRWISRRGETDDRATGRNHSRHKRHHRRVKDRA